MPAAGARAGWTALWFCVGILGTAALPVLPALWLKILIMVALVALVLHRRIRPLAGLAVGILWFTLAADALRDRTWPPERAGETIELIGRVASLPEQRDGRARVEFQLESLHGDPDRGRVLLGWYRPLEWFRPGERWRIRARLEPPHGRSNPGLFDYQRYLFARGITAVGRIVEAERVEPGDWRGATDRFRQRFADWLQAETASLEAAALQRALIVADRSAMSPELAEQLRRTGTAHLLSISGLHVGMVAGLIGLLAGLIATPLLGPLGATGRKRLMLIAGLGGALAYSALAGFSLPTVRALVMLSAGFGALLWRRPLQPGRALLVALTVVLALDPLAVLSIGFWLSFGAVAVLIWAFAGRSSGRGWLAGLVWAQIVIAIGLMPLNVGIFGQWAPTALAANLFAIPLVGFWVLPCLLLSLAGFALGLPAALPTAGAEIGLKLFLALTDRLLELDSSLRSIAEPTGPAPGLAAMALAFIGALWLLAPRAWPMRPLGLALLLPLLWPPSERPGPGEFDLSVPDLGDGHAVLIETAGHTWLYGTGPGDGAERSLVPGTLSPLVRASGRRRVDGIIVPFEHADYAGGEAAARAEWPAAEVLAPGAGCTAGREWAVDGVQFRILHPGAALPDLRGDSSCVLELRSPAGSALLSGGIGAVVGRRLRDQGAEPVDVLLLPRGGHRDALDDGWLAALQPSWSIASASAYNRRGLPHEQTRSRITERGGRLLTTGDCGHLRVAFRAERSVRIQAHRLERERYWRSAEACRRAYGSRAAVE